MGHQWKLSNYGLVAPNPAGIHCVLLHQGISPDYFDSVFYQWITKKHPKRNCIHIYGQSNTGKSSLFAGLRKCCPAGEILNGQNFNFEGLIDAYWGVWEEPLLAPEIAEKFKQIAEGMECAIAVKFKKPYTLPRTPIIITTNSMIWEWCPNQEGPLKNRMWFFTFNNDMSSGIFDPRTSDTSCQCRYCQRCSGGSAGVGCSTTPSMQRRKQPIQEQLASRDASREPDVGTGSMPGTTDRSGQSDRAGCSSGESGSNNAAGGSSSTDPSSGNGSSTEHGSGSSTERICNTRTRSQQSVGTTTAGRHSGDDSGGVREGTSGTSRCRDVRRNSGGDEKISTMVSMGGTRQKKRKMEFQVQTDQQHVGGELVTKMTVPGKDEWSAYLSYLYHRFEKKEPDLHCYEELEDSE